jgi:hypothetical protein
MPAPYQKIKPFLGNIGVRNCVTYLTYSSSSLEFLLRTARIKLSIPEKSMHPINNDPIPTSQIPSLTSTGKWFANECLNTLEP